MPDRILVADDEPANRELLQQLLASEQLEVVLTEDGRQALEEFRSFQPDLVLLDIQMPHMDGLEVCRQIKDDPETRLTPVVLVTALSATEDRIRGLQAGADDFLTKPVERALLLAKIRSLLRVKTFTDELERAESVLFALALSIEGKDPYTQGHCERLSEYSAALGRQIGLGQEEVAALRRAGVVHDIGKVAVPDAVLLKPARLTPEEFQIMKEHPALGERICAPLKSFRLVLPIIRHHHEKRDGSGYPDGLRGDQVPLTARVLQVVDVYDALTTERPYKKSLSTAEALAIMEQEVKKGWWDPAIFQAFATLAARGGFAGAAGGGQ